MCAPWPAFDPALSFPDEEREMERVMEANRLYNQMDNHDRDDAMAMRYLIPGWRYDSKKPCLVR